MSRPLLMPRSPGGPESGGLSQVTKPGEYDTIGALRPKIREASSIINGPAAVMVSALTQQFWRMPSGYTHNL